MAGELTASIAHEINQPLGSIHMNAETLELILNDQEPDLDEIRELAAEIRRDDERASDVIIRLRSILKRKPFELRPLLSAVRNHTEDGDASLEYGRAPFGALLFLRLLGSERLIVDFGVGVVGAGMQMAVRG